MTTSPIWAIAALTIAIVSCAMLSHIAPLDLVSGQFASIDGLRGYLAFFVFLYHSSIWYGLLTTGEWMPPASHLYTHFGHTSVALFFMVTGLLFFEKLIDPRPIDWGALFVGRVVRLYPLYLAMLSVVLVITAVRSGSLNEEPSTLSMGIFKWMTFTVLGAVDLNKVPRTWMIVAGVTWSLAYEWLFYAVLPGLALFTGRRVPLLYLCLSLVAAIAAVVGTTYWPYVLSFMGGIIACVASRSALVRRFATSRYAPFIILACIAAEIRIYPTAFLPGALGLLTVAFTLIANGCSLFGALTATVSRLLGALSYGIYLLHGLVLYLGMTAVRGGRWGSSLTPQSFWLMILVLTPILIALAYGAFRFVEHPAMQRTRAIVNRLRRPLVMRPQTGPFPPHAV